MKIRSRSRAPDAKDLVGMPPPVLEANAAIHCGLRASRKIKGLGQIKVTALVGVRRWRQWLRAVMAIALPASAAGQSASGSQSRQAHANAPKRSGSHISDRASSQACYRRAVERSARLKRSTRHPNSATISPEQAGSGRSRGDDGQNDLVESPDPRLCRRSRSSLRHRDLLTPACGNSARPRKEVSDPGKRSRI